MNLETIAKIIGYYFWHCNNDEAAIKHGMELALKINEALEGG